MTMHRIRRVAAAGLAAALGVGLMAGPAQAAAQRPAHHHHKSGGPVVVVSGLNNPRQLALTNHGHRLLIAEAGKGGDVATFPSPEGGTTFVGASGSISAVWFPRSADNWRPHRIVTGLMSGAAKDGSGAVGSDGVAIGRHGRIYIQETFAPTDLPTALAAQNGMLLKARPFHRPTAVADITGYERANDPDGYGFDSDPYAVIPYFGGHLVADAAANDVLWVAPWGGIFLFHTFFNVTTGACSTQEDPPGHPGCNFVPNTLATDRRGNVYVGGLSSLTPGEAQVVKLDRFGHVRKTWFGFTSVTGLAVRGNGTLFVSQLFGAEANPPSPMIQGVVTRVSASGNRTNMDVPFPTGLALHGNDLYVSAFSIAPDSGLGAPGTSGQVWRIRVHG
jgi:hypothetical protein